MCLFKFAIVTADEYTTLYTVNYVNVSKAYFNLIQYTDLRDKPNGHLFMRVWTNLRYVNDQRDKIISDWLRS